LILILESGSCKLDTEITRDMISMSGRKKDACMHAQVELEKSPGPNYFFFKFQTLGCGDGEDEKGHV